MSEVPMYTINLEETAEDEEGVAAPI